MKTTFNEDMIPSFELDEYETYELHETGFVVTEDGFCITYVDGEYTIYKEFDEYDGLKVHHEGD